MTSFEEEGQLTGRERAAQRVNDYLEGTDWRPDPKEEGFEYRFKAEAMEVDEYIQIAQVRDPSEPHSVRNYLRYTAPDFFDRLGENFFVEWASALGPFDSSDMLIEKANQVLDKL